MDTIIRLFFLILARMAIAMADKLANFADWVVSKYE